MRQKLQEKNIDISHLVEWPVDHCQQAESSTQEESSEYKRDEGNERQPSVIKTNLDN